MTRDSTRARPAWPLVLGLALLTIAAFTPIWHADFVSLDDPLYVTRNPNVTGGLSRAGLVWAFTTGHAANWHPLTWLSHMLDVELFGLEARPHHLVNLALHVSSTLLLFGWLRRATGARWRSALVAALFAVHPLRVESVAWIAERKDVLSGCLCMLTLWAYVGYAQKRSAPRYVLVTVLFALGLLAKPMLVTVPALMLLLDWWPLHRTETTPWQRLVVEKLPLLLLAAISSWITVVVQREGGALSGLAAFPIGARSANAIVSYGQYLRDVAWPSGLAVFYPFPRSLSAGAVIGTGAVLALVTGGVAVLARRVRYPAVGWLWYLGMLVPVIGLVPVGLQGHADRYTYLPLIGLFIVVAWAAGDLADRRPALRPAVTALAVAAIVACVAVTREQVAYWHDGMTLWRRAADVVPDNYRAHLSLGMLLLADSHPQDALPHLQEAVRLEPDLTEAHRQIARILVMNGRVLEATRSFGEVARLQPASAAAHSDFGQALAGAGRVDEALAQYQEALRLDPALAEAHNNLGSVLAAQGRIADALPHFADAVRLKPNYEQAHINLALAFARLARYDDAMRELSEVLRINPANGAARQAFDDLRRRRDN